MVKRRDQTRRLRPVFYQLRWDDQSLYIQSRIAAIIVRDAWCRAATDQKQTTVIEMYCVISNKLNKLYTVIDIVGLLNGTWESMLLTKHTYVEGELTKVFINRSNKELLTRCNKLRINDVYFNNDMRKTLDAACQDASLMEVCFKSPSANVFVTAVNLLVADDNEFKEKISKHARDIYYVLRKPLRRPKSKARTV